MQQMEASFLDQIAKTLPTERPEDRQRAAERAAEAQMLADRMFEQLRADGVPEEVLQEIKADATARGRSLSDSIRVWKRDEKMRRRAARNR